MVKFWKMLIAMLAMMAMVVVPTSCDKDEDENANESNSNTSSINGKVFVDEIYGPDYIRHRLYSFNDGIVTFYLKDILFGTYVEGESFEQKYSYEELSNGLIRFDGELYKYKNGNLYFTEDGNFIESEDYIDASEDKTGRTPEQIINGWGTSDSIQ